MRGMVRVRVLSATVVVVAAGDRLIIASDPNEPVNHAHGGVGPTRDAALTAAAAAVGAHANDLSARCSWNPRPTP